MSCVRECRALGSVYDEETGVQKCLCHDVCTPDFLKWEKERFDALSARVGTSIPMSKRPPWESVGALRHECCRRSYTPQEKARLDKMTTTEAQMQHWLLARCRRKCVVSKMARLTMWQLGLGEALFEADIGDGEIEQGSDGVTIACK